MRCDAADEPEGEPTVQRAGRAQAVGRAVPSENGLAKVQTVTAGAPRPYPGTVLLWKWFSYLDGGGADDNDYTPRRKPAEVVLAHYYGGK